jgi:acyl-[acyl-carrier-protein]-phospholipid O-acyltransferase/long-chain-fatty-acid--[acyl-carrier-protein] ligase
VLVTQQKDVTRSQFMTYAREKGASELMVPSEVMVMDKVPVLGSGKVDLVNVAALVKEQYAAKEAPPLAQAHG